MKAFLDGRNRYRACLAVGVEPRYREYTGDNPIGFVVSLNLNRRHLNESQRAVIAARLANMPLGGAIYRSEKNNGVQICTPKISLEQSAELLNVSRRTVAAVKAVEREAPELIKKIESGEMTAHEAEKKVRQMKREKQREEMAREAENVKPSERWKIWRAER